MRLKKCDTYIVKETLWHRGRKSYISAVRGVEKRKKNQRGTRGEAKTQTNNLPKEEEEIRTHGRTEQSK